MRRFIITGAPGAGKTAMIRQLELDALSPVEEAATDVISRARARATAHPGLTLLSLMRLQYCKGASDSRILSSR